MSKRAGDENTVETLRVRIRSVFPDVVFLGQITPADKETGEDFDDERTLHAALHGKRWSEIPASFLSPSSYSIPLLTEEAFEAFLPAWLSRALDDGEVRRAVVYAFSPKQREGSQSFMDCRIRRLSGPQRDAIRELMAHFIAVETSKFVQEHARRALEYISAF